MSLLRLGYTTADLHEMGFLLLEDPERAACHARWLLGLLETYVLLQILPRDLLKPWFGPFTGAFSTLVFLVAAVVLSRALLGTSARRVTDGVTLCARFVPPSLGPVLLMLAASVLFAMLPPYLPELHALLGPRLTEAELRAIIGGAALVIPAAWLASLAWSLRHGRPAAPGADTHPPPRADFVLLPDGGAWVWGLRLRNGKARRLPDAAAVARWREAERMAGGFPVGPIGIVLAILAAQIASSLVGQLCLNAAIGTLLLLAGRWVVSRTLEGTREDPSSVLPTGANRYDLDLQLVRALVTVCVAFLAVRSAADLWRKAAPGLWHSDDAAMAGVAWLAIFAWLGWLAAREPVPLSISFQRPVQPEPDTARDG